MTETGQTTKTAINLRNEFLGASDQKTLSVEGAFHAPYTTTGSENSEPDFTLSNSDRHLLHAAATAERGDSASFILPGAQQSDSANPRSEAGKRKKREEIQQTQLTLVEQARQLSERLAKHIALMEAAFEADMGDAWREKIANKVMDPDDIPQRRDGESMQDYRQRLESIFIATMIDENGNIRPEYANSDDPDVRSYAAWAQAQHTKRGADAYLEERNDPSLSQADREALDIEFRSSSSFAKLQQASADHRAPTDVTNDLGNALDEQQDEEVTALNVEARSFEI